MEHAGAEIDDLIFDRVSAFEKAGSRHQQPSINRRRPGASSCKALADVFSCAGFSDAGMTMPSTRCGRRRPRSAKARNRGRWAAAVQRTQWGFGHGVRLEGLERSGRGDRLCGESNGACGSRRVGRTLHDKIGGESADHSGGPTRARALPAESRREWQGSLPLSIGGDGGLMKCRSG